MSPTKPESDKSPVKTRSGQAKVNRDKVQRTLSDSTLAPPTDNEAVRSAVEGILLNEQFMNRIVELVAGKISELVNQQMQAALQQALSEVERLKSELGALQKHMLTHVKENKMRADDIEQYQRRNNLRVFGIEEKEGEDTDRLLVDIFKNKLNLDVKIADIDRSHRVGPRPQTAEDGRKKHRPIIVKFVSYRSRKDVFLNKKKLKGSGVTIREDLTAHRAILLRQATERYGTGNVWTLDGNINWICDGKRGRATSSLPPLDHQRVRP